MSSPHPEPRTPTATRLKTALDLAISIERSINETEETE